VNNPTVSVAIATYNRAAMVCQGIEAALGQTQTPFEVCVADDASTDGTWPALQEFARREPRLRVFRHEKNTGGVGNWNFAIAQTSGDYIAWCSDDDRFLPDHLAASIEYLETHSEIGLVHSGFVDAIETDSGVATTETRPQRFTRDTVLDRGGLLPYLIRYYDWPFHPSTIVMRRAVWQEVGPFDSRYALADTDWFVRAVEKFPVAMLARDGVLNRRHPGNWSNRVGSAKMQREIFEIVEGAVNRLHSANPMRRALWKWAWRMNVRLRLLLTVRTRIRTGHAEAACSAWSQLWDGTGLRLPQLFRRVGEVAIQKRAGRRVTQFQDARQSVSPL
jgi:glycosyltransferase involved in cell wall biosynthesis